MLQSSRPRIRPSNPNFSSGPCSKRLGWSLSGLKTALVGRSHRSTEGKDRLKLAIDRTRSLLDLPSDFLIAIVPGSDTGAVEMALWSMLGARGVDVLAWESFGRVWVGDILKELKLRDSRLLDADFGFLPNLALVDFSRDVVFTANGTTAGVRVPNYDWIASDREGLTLADATSAVFVQAIDWRKIDVAAFSWQKVLGGEAAHGMLVLSPRAVARLESYCPPWPVPKLFRLTKGGKVDRSIFAGETINTPSMLCVEDYLNALDWADSVGGVAGLTARADANSRVLYDWMARTEWVRPLAVDSRTRSNTSVCMRFKAPHVLALPEEAQLSFAKRIAGLLEQEGVARDIGSYRGAPPGLRIWAGPTVEKSDLDALTPWLDWAFAEVSANLVMT
jgi:phosphoserine aminotransferase